MFAAAKRWVTNLVWHVRVRQQIVSAWYRRWFTYRHFDSTEYWKKRAALEGEARVLWRNKRYNRLARKEQKKVLWGFVDNLKNGTRLLDLGCGIGVLSHAIVSRRPDLFVDGVDFSEMVSAAIKERPHPQLRYIVGEAESYRPEKKYDFILSAGCISAIKDTAKLEKALHNCSEMLAPGGTLLFIEPFHRLPPLVRSRYSSRQVQKFLAERGLALVKRSGILFWPFRLQLIGPKYHHREIERRFEVGEKLLRYLGPHFWADYKILAFRSRR